MIRAYCLLAATTMVVNAPTLAAWIALIHPIPSLSASRKSAALAAPTAFVAKAAPTAFVAKVEKESDGLFRLTGLANGRPVQFIVDTGATVTVLTTQDAIALNLSSSHPDGSATLKTAGGTAAMAWKRLDRLEVAGANLRHLDVVMVRGDLDHSLLGQDVLSQLGTVTMTNDQLEIRHPPV